MEPLAGVALQLEDIEFTRDSIGKEYLLLFEKYQPGTLQLFPVMFYMKLLKCLKNKKMATLAEFESATNFLEGNCSSVELQRHILTNY